MPVGSSYTNLTYSIEPLALYDVIVHPSFTDLLPPGDGAYDGVLYDFVVMDNVPVKRPIIDITKVTNIMRRRDASCDVIAKRIGTTALRYIETSEVMTATENCRTEFYQGALKDFRNYPEVFENKITPFFLAATRTDIASNAWFGDVTRSIISGANFNTTSYDGIVKWLNHYTTAGSIAAAQTVTPPTVDFYQEANWEAAYELLLSLIANQTILLRNVPNGAKIIYCDTSVHYGYKKYLQSIGTQTEKLIMNWENGLEVDSIDGIAIVPVPLWEPILYELNSNAVGHHLVILTMRNNFIFGTDKEYGEGEDGKTALEIFYWRKDMTWNWRQYMKAGTQIALPEYIVWGMN